MNYQEWAPPPDLVPWIKCLWALTARPGEVGPETVVPDGRPELVIHFADGFEQQTAAGFRRQATALFVGPGTRPVVIRPSGEVRILGVRLHPWGAAPLLRDDVSGVRNRIEPLHDLAPGPLLDLRAVGALPVEEWPIAAARVLREVFGGARIDPRVPRLVGLIERRAGRVDLRDLAREVHVGERQVERLLSRAVGVSPKPLARVVRFQAALGALSTARVGEIGRVAHELGYFDHAHLVRECRRLALCSPTDLVRGERALSEAFLG